MRYLLVAFATLGILLGAFAYASDDQEQPQDYARSLQILRGNYRGLVEDIAVVKLTCENRERILDEIADAFETYATAEELGFSEEEYEQALDNFFQRHCDKVSNSDGKGLLRRPLHFHPRLYTQQTSCIQTRARYYEPMSTKTIVISVVVIIIVLIGGYFVAKSMGSGTPGAAPATTTAATTADTSQQVQGQDVKVGTGATATPGSQVSVLYVGKLPDGTVFDSSAAHGNTPLVFTLGAQGLIPGFQIGVNGMKVGGERLLAIPAALGYGTQDVKDSTGKVIIPANSTLIFDVQLVKVEAGSSTPAKAQ